VKKGIVQVYTGDGKGKTTASVGLAIRSAGQGLKVGFFQFFKPPVSGEIKIFQRIDNIKFYSYFQKHPAFQKFNNKDVENYKEKFSKVLEEILEEIRKEKFDVVILDEILIALRDGFLEEDELIDFIEKKPEYVEIVLTGRYKLNEKLKKKVQLITEMKNVKHPYPQIKVRKGIEF